MSEKKSKGKVLFFVPHADDLEFGAPLAAIHFLKK
jgi:LmbE family N-acetylglucosaminyl deacetylase